MLAPLLLLVLQTAQPCNIPGLGDLARCGVVTVPEDRQRSNGRRLTLPYVLVPATGASARSADQVPIVFLPGGPGGDVIRQAPAWTQLLAGLRKQHPLLFIDPRGTGESHALHCQLAADPRRVVSHVRDFLPIAQVRSCRRELEKRADLAQYTTETIAQDLDAVRAALGFERMILFGTSGGTRQSLKYLKRYPRRVDAMILSGTVPLTFRMPMHYAPDAQAAFDSLAAACAADRECTQSFPTLREDFELVLSTLARRPRSVAVDLPGGGVDSAIVTRGIFAERMRTLLYDAEAAAQAPYVIARAARGDYAPFIQVMIPNLRPPRRSVVAMGHFLSVTCAEDVPRIARDSAIALATRTFLGTYRLDQQRAACAEWPRAHLPADHFEPARSDVPVLFISGAADPVTPARWADTAARHLPNSVHAVMAHAAHGPLFNACARTMMEEFVKTRDPKRVDVRCAREMRRPRFYAR